METSRITGEGLHISTNARHSWPLSSEGSLACHTYCDAGHMTNGHLRGPVILTPVAERLAVERLLHEPVLTTWLCRDWDSNTQTVYMRDNRSNPRDP